MAEAFAVAASVITLVNTSRKAVEGIAKLAGLRHAPEILLALNNEVVDLQCVLEDLTDLEHKFHDTLQEAFTPSLRRTIDRTTAVLLALDELIAYRLTKPGSRAGILRVDRSTWLRSQDRIGHILEDVRDCRIRLANAMAIVTASLTVRSYNVSRRLGIQMEAFMADNDECHQEIAHRLVGVRNQPVRSVTPATPEAERSDSNTEREDVFVSNPSSSTTTEHDAIMPNVLVRVLRRRPCHSACSCMCHQTQRLLSPGIVQRLIGNLFIGYTGLPTPFRRCNVLGCRQNSPAHAKLFYRFPSWFCKRAINLAFFGGGLCPELILRFPCVRPLHSEWGEYIRDGRVDDLKRLINCKQVSLQDVDNTFGLTALHWALEYGWVDLASFLVRAGADLAAEDGFGLTPRHCLLFGYTWLNFHIPRGDEEMFLRRQSNNFDIPSDSELLEEPALCKTYRGKDTHDTVRASLNSLGGINDVDALGGTLLMKAVRRADEPTVRLLLDNGASATQRNRHGYTCIWFACWEGCSNIVRLLLKHGAIPTIGTFWEPRFDALAAAVFRNRHDIMSILFEHLNGQYDFHPLENLNILHVVAWRASIQTIELLCSIRYTSKDIWATINSSDNSCQTPYGMTQFRRRDKQGWTRYLEEVNKPDEDLEVFNRAFIKLVQKIVDDHYGGFDGYQTNGQGRCSRRMVAVPRKGSTRLIDIVEEASMGGSLEDAFQSDRVEESISDAEEWEDALEDPEEATEMSLR